MSTRAGLRRWLLSTSRGRFVSTGLMVVAASLLMDRVVMPVYVRHNWELRVPDVNGMPIEEAEPLLRDRGLRVVRQEQVNAAVPPGHVISQVPLANSLVKTGRRVYLHVSRAAAPVQVPKVEGSEREARLIVANAQLQLGGVQFDVSNYYPAGVVMAQSPAPGTRVPAGTPVDITISLGQASMEPIVPNVRNMDLTTARKEILKAGLTVGLIDTVIMPEYLPNTVLLQSDEPGTALTPGDAVDLLTTALTGSTTLRSEALQRLLDSAAVDFPQDTP